MRLHHVAGPVLLSFLALACSDSEGESKVGPGDGGGAMSSGGTTNGTGNGAAGAVSLGGRVGAGDGGDGSGEEMPDLPSEVNVIITADNAYGFGYGTKSRLENYFGGVENQESSDIFDCPVGNGPEQYVVPAEDANAGGYLYIVGYADKSTTQGVIAKFFREGAQPVYTGTGNWEVCATGEDYDPGSGGPDRETIDEYIAKCNAAELDAETSSVGWVNANGNEHGRVVFGEDNGTTRDAPEPGNEFLIACDIEPSARWMWFDWVVDRRDGSAFLWPGSTENVTKDFLIFRLGADQIPSKPPK
ncbi:MAG: hypothetical protein EOO73_20485 [Myxococcales bacterium]|nr:MAG: hypothetical protein EOO73_20485 [Myxococcales bacterium]